MVEVCLLPAGGCKQVFQPRPLFIPFAQTKSEEEEEGVRGEVYAAPALTLPTITPCDTLLKDGLSGATSASQPTSQPASHGDEGDTPSPRLTPRIPHDATG